MKIKSIDLPNGYSTIICQTAAGYAISKIDEAKGVLYISFTNKEFEILNEIRFDNYSRNDNKPVVNPNDNTIVGYLHVDNNLKFLDLTGKTIKSFDVKCAAASYDNENKLYTAHRIDSENLEISLYDNDFNLIASKRIEDPLCDSYVEFHYYPKTNRMFLDLAGGQDGSEYYTLDIIDNEIFLHEFMADIALVETNETNSCFMCVDPYETEALYYTYLDKKLVSSFNYYDHFDEDGEINYTIVHLKDELYMISFDGRMYLFDAPSATVKEEIVIEKHEAKPTKHFYPSLDEEGLMTDIIIASRFGNIIGFSTIGNNGFYIDVADIINKL